MKMDAEPEPQGVSLTMTSVLFPSDRTLHSPRRYQGFMIIVNARQTKKARLRETYFGASEAKSLAKGRTFSKTQEKRRE